MRGSIPSKWALVLLPRAGAKDEDVKLVGGAP